MSKRVPVKLLGNAIALGTAIDSNDITFPIIRNKNRLKIACKPDTAPNYNIKENCILTFSWNDNKIRKSIKYGFTLSDKGKWYYYNATVICFKINKVSFSLVDVDCDGIYGNFPVDGICMGDSRVILPLTKTIFLNSHTLYINSISSDGTKIQGSLEEISGTEDQIQVLSDLNLLRANNGLTPVIIDEILSKGCNDHAHYLKINKLSGNTKEAFSQYPELKGYSPEGAIAAKNSCISNKSLRDSIPRFWCSYFNRIGLINPHLTRIGTNVDYPDISVLDDISGWGRSNKMWAFPIIVPADGSINVPLKSRYYEPSGTGVYFPSCGFPIMVRFHHLYNNKATEFKCEIYMSTKKKLIKIPVFDAIQDSSPFLFGVVPQYKLKPLTTYQANISYLLNNIKHTKTIKFKTGK